MGLPLLQRKAIAAVFVGCHLRVVVAFERNEVAVTRIRALQRAAVPRHDEVVAVGVREQRGHKRAACSLDGRHIVKVEVAAALDGDAEESDCGGDQ